MGYMDAQKFIALVDGFLESINEKPKVDSARSFFENKMRDLWRSCENGEIERGALGEKVGNLLRDFTVYLNGQNIRDLQKTIDRT